MNGGGERDKHRGRRAADVAGWTPSVHLFSQSRGKVALTTRPRRFLPGTYAQDCVSVGACNGTES